MKKKYTLEEIKTKYPDYKVYLKLLKKMKFKKVDWFVEGVFMGVEHENKYINSDIEEFLCSKLIPKEGINGHQFESKCEECLNKLPDFLNFLIKSL